MPLARQKEVERGLMMLWSPSWVGKASGRQLSLACKHERRFLGGQRVEVGARQMQAASPVSQKGFWA